VGVTPERTREQNKLARTARKVAATGLFAAAIQNNRIKLNGPMVAGGEKLTGTKLVKCFCF